MKLFVHSISADTPVGTYVEQAFFYIQKRTDVSVAKCVSVYHKLCLEIRFYGSMSICSS